MIFKSFLIKFHWILVSQIGIDPQRILRSLLGMPNYLRDWVTFRRAYFGKMRVAPCLHDRYEEGGATKSEYFWQDLLVARAINDANPVRHVDIGSRVDGFVAHVASFREIEVFDVRPISTAVPGVVFRQADLMDMTSLPVTINGYCDSLSCLHAIEHFGLGRYGDSINAQGLEIGMINMVKLLKIGGLFYLSTPIGEERVEFNANWVFDPRRIIQCANACGMMLQKLTIVTADNGPQESTLHPADIAALALKSYQLGIFIFMKAGDAR